MKNLKIIVIVALLATSIFAQSGWKVNETSNMASPVLNSDLSTNDNILGTGMYGYELNCTKTSAASYGYVKITKSFSAISTKYLSAWFRNNNDATNWTVYVYLGANPSPITSAGPLALSLTGDNVKMTFDLGSMRNFDRIEFMVSYKSNSGLTRTIWFNDLRIDGNVVIDSYGPTPLPVELNSFIGKMTSKGVNLNWMTATEVNNYGFEVERKTAENDWEKIAFVPGNGNSNSPKKYSYTDTDKLTTRITYRLKQIDTDGKFVYSQEISINTIIVPKFLMLNSYPNPFNPATTINFTLPESSQANLSVYNALGQKVAELFNGNSAAGVKEIKFDGSNLPSGTYFVRIVTPTGQITKKILLLK